MKKDRIKAYVLEIILVIFLIYTLFFTKLSNKIELAIFLIIYALILKYLIKRPVQLDIKKKQATKVIITTAILYIAIYYMVGIYSGFYKALHSFSLITFGKYILPISLTIIASEYIRSKFLTVESKVSKVFNFIICVLIDMSIYSNIYGLSNLDEFLVSIGYLLFASIACNLLYNYISKRYGMKPVIIYRLITTLYLYIIPVTPDIYIFFRTFFRMLYPLIIYYILEENFGNRQQALSVKKDKNSNIVGIIFLTAMVLFIMVISCHFKYCALVIGSGSMTGTIDKGDVIIYDSKIDNSDIKIGDILVFDKNGTKLVHRVINIEYLNNSKVYYTKGDYNQKADEGYIKDDNIYGRVNFKIKKIGKPTIWLHDMFKKNRKGDIND